MIKSTLRKLSIGIFLLSFISLNMTAQEKSKKESEFNFIPQIDFGILQIEKDTFLYSPSGNLQFKYQKNDGSEKKGPDVIAGSLSYGQDFFSKKHQVMKKTFFTSWGFLVKSFLAKIHFF